MSIERCIEMLLDYFALARGQRAMLDNGTLAAALSCGMFFYISEKSNQINEKMSGLNSYLNLNGVKDAVHVHHQTGVN